MAECELGRVQVERSVPITEHPPSGALIRPDPTLVTLRPALHTLRPALHTLEPLSAVERVSGDRSAKCSHVYSKLMTPTGVRSQPQPPCVAS